mmetsp:Transcript_101213/g.179760  ORF Transcript_101213/g.179760 Transcript_101213/m.179760 type:complete len:355 (-) Transcript_101213:12-1076(-)
MDSQAETLQRSLPGQSALVPAEGYSTLRTSRLEQSLSGTSKLVAPTSTAAKLETFRYTSSSGSARDDLQVGEAKSRTKSSSRTLPGESFSLSGTSTFVLPEVDTGSRSGNEASASGGKSSRFAEEVDELRQMLAKEALEDGAATLVDDTLEEEEASGEQQLTLRLDEAILPAVGLGIGALPSPEPSSKTCVSPSPLSEDLYDSSCSGLDKRPKVPPARGESSISDVSWASQDSPRTKFAAGATLDYSCSDQADGKGLSFTGKSMSWTGLFSVPHGPEGSLSLSISEDFTRSLQGKPAADAKRCTVGKPSFDDKKLEAFTSAVRDANGLGKELQNELLELLQDMPGRSSVGPKKD